MYEDRSGPVLAELLRAAGCDVVDGPLVIPDGDAVERALRDAVAGRYDVAVTTGGTGLTPTDLTPEMTRRVLDREIPGIAEALTRALEAGADLAFVSGSGPTVVGLFFGDGTPETGARRSASAAGSLAGRRPPAILATPVGASFARALMVPVDEDR